MARPIRIEVAYLRVELVRALSNAPVSDSERIMLLSELLHNYARKTMRPPRNLESDQQTLDAERSDDDGA